MSQTCNKYFYIVGAYGTGFAFRLQNSHVNQVAKNIIIRMAGQVTSVAQFKFNHIQRL